MNAYYFEVHQTFRARRTLNTVVFEMDLWTLPESNQWLLRFNLKATENLEVKIEEGLVSRQPPL